MPLPRTMSSSSEPLSRSSQREWAGRPTTIRLTFRWRAKERSASLTLTPESDTVSAPSSSASFSVRARAWRSAAESAGWAGLST